MRAETAVPVGVLLADVAGEHVDDLLQGLLGHDRPDTRSLDAVTAHEHRQLRLEDPDRQVLVILTQDVLVFARNDLTRALTRIHNDLSDLEHECSLGTGSGVPSRSLASHLSGEKPGKGG